MSLKATRIAAGKTQIQVADAAKVTEVCYQRYEAGARTPRADTAIKIAEALNVNDFTRFKAMFLPK